MPDNGRISYGDFILLAQNKCQDKVRGGLCRRMEGQTVEILSGNLDYYIWGIDGLTQMLRDIPFFDFKFSPVP